jgi:glycopeptide antibiotics resistance protein
VGGGRRLRGLLAAWLVATLLATLAPFWPLRSAPRTFAAASRLGPLDFVLNIVLFLPCGVLLAMLGRRTSTAMAAAALLSLAVESAQMWIPHRYPSQLDVLANALGALLGALVVRLGRPQDREVAGGEPEEGRPTRGAERGNGTGSA